MSFKDSFLDVMAFRNPTKPPICEFLSYWPETIELYRDKLEDEEPHAHFKLGSYTSLPVKFGFFPAFDFTILEDRDDRQIVRDEAGITKIILKNSSAMPHYIDFPIKNRKDFEMIRETRLDPLSPGRYIDDWESFAKITAVDGKLYGMIAAGPFAFMRDNILFEDLMVLFADDPDLIKEMATHQVDFLIKLWERALTDITPGFIYIGEDMAYKNGTMISPAMVEKFIAPAWDKLITFLRNKGVKNVILDSDGNIEQIIDMAIECGFNIILPIERAAGMDAEVLRKRYPRIGMIGGVDKMELSKGRAAIDAEIIKAARVYSTGGYIPCCDHAVPPTVPYENYVYYLDKLKEALTKTTIH